MINDPSYDWLDGKTYGFYLAAGPQHLDGKHALAYVRSRHGADNSDWARSSRQQQVLVALLHKMAQPSEILALPGLISTLGSSVTTNFPADQVADYVAIGQNIPSKNISQVVLGPPYYDHRHQRRDRVYAASSTPRSPRCRSSCSARTAPGTASPRPPTPALSRFRAVAGESVRLLVGSPALGLLAMSRAGPCRRASLWRLLTVVSCVGTRKWNWPRCAQALSKRHPRQRESDASASTARQH